jgi:HPt (histidine-containing phosphotransfer) domain-containing protein
MSEEAVRKMTFRYLPDLEESMERLEEAHRAGRDVVARREAHTIAGTSAQFGFTEVSAAARLIEHHAAPASESARPEVEALREVVERVMGALKPLAAAEKDERGGRGSEGGVREVESSVPEGLRQRLEEGDALGARQLLERLRGEWVRQTLAALETYDFEAALTLVDGVMKQK